MKASLGILAAFLAIAGLMTACSKSADAPAATSARAASAPASAAVHDTAGIAWKYVSGDAGVDAAFAQAKAEGKPLFLYWGAKWCPPCNHVKATLFNRVDFIERSRAFVPVYVDGDKPGAQKLGARFKVRGYPTMVLFNAQGTELTRLPGEVDPAQYTQVLTVGMNAQRPVKQVLADARAGRPLAPNDWKLLAFYAWETDEQQAAGKDDTAALLHQLALACPADQVDTRTRLRLKAMARWKARTGSMRPGASGCSASWPTRPHRAPTWTSSPAAPSRWFVPPARRRRPSAPASSWPTSTR